jgi:hypothetical protein
MHKWLPGNMHITSNTSVTRLTKFGALYVLSCILFMSRVRVKFGWHNLTELADVCYPEEIDPSRTPVYVGAGNTLPDLDGRSQLS